MNPSTGQVLIVDDPSGALSQNWRIPTDEEVDDYAKRLDYGGFADQALAQTERVVRGATLGAVEGLSGDSADARARADVSEELSPFTSAVADIVPQVGLGALAATGVGAAAVGLGAAAGGLVAGGAALAAESLAAGTVQASQEAYRQGRYFGDDLGLDAENALIWGGVNFGLGAAIGGASKLLRRGAATDAARLTGDELSDVALASEAKALRELPETPGAALADDGVPVPTAASDAAPLDNVRMLDAEGYMDTAAPEQVATVAPEIREFAREGIAGRSLDDLKALELDEGDRAMVERLKGDEGFVASGNVQDNFGSDRGGLPRLALYGDEVTLQNGRHRLTAAREAGREEIVFHVTKYDETGNPLWDYVGPVRIEPRGPDVPSAANAAAERAAEVEYAEDGFERAVSRASRSDADDLVARALREKTPAGEASSFGRQRRLYANREAILDVSVREMQQDLTEVTRAARELSGEGKMADIARNVGANHSAQQATADRVARDAAEFAGQLRAEARDYAKQSGKSGLLFPVPGQKALVGALMDHADAIVKAETPRARFEAIDEFKRVMQKQKLALEAGAENSANPIHHQGLIPRVQEFASKLRTELESSDTWGRAGEMQRSYNAVIHDQLPPSMRMFEGAVMKRTGRDYDAVWQTEGWESKIASLLKGNDLGKMRHVNAVLDGMDQLAAVQARYGGEGAGKGIAERVAKIRRTMGLAREVSSATETVEAAAEVADMVPIFGRSLKGAIRGDVANAFRRLRGATDEAVTRSVDDWIRSSKVRGGGFSLPELPKLNEEHKALLALAARRGTSVALARFQGDDDSLSQSFERRREALLNADKFFEALGNDYVSLQNQAPEAHMMLAAQATAARQVLIDKMPSNVSVSILRPLGHPPSREAIEDWAYHWNAVEDPISVMRNLPAASADQVKTVKTVYPRLFEATQMKFLERVGQAQAAGVELEDSSLLRLHLLFDGDELVPPIFSLKLARVAHESAAAQKQKQPGQPAPVDKTPTDGVAGVLQNGPTFGAPGAY
jgi:hypothetical protein